MKIFPHAVCAKEQLQAMRAHRKTKQSIVGCAACAQKVLMSFAATGAKLSTRASSEKDKG
jgi:hypothetical protein